MIIWQTDEGVTDGWDLVVGSRDIDQGELGGSVGLNYAALILTTLMVGFLLIKSALFIMRKSRTSEVASAKTVP